MPRRPPVRLVLGVALCLLAGGGCGDEAPREPPPPMPEPLVEEPAPALPAPVDSADTPPTPFDAAPIVFDTTEPPEQVVQIPNRRPPTAPDPEPQPAAPPPPDAGPSGSCDVRATESFCFAYTGSGWTPQSARAHCADAPDATFSGGACPLRDRIATCTFRRPSDPSRELVYSYYEPYDLGLAELACPGTFTRVR